MQRVYKLSYNKIGKPEFLLIPSFKIRQFKALHEIERLLLLFFSLRGGGRHPNIKLDCTLYVRTNI